MNRRSFLKYRRRLGTNLQEAIRGVFTEYETPKLVLIHSLTIGVLLRIMQIIILVYSIIYLLIYEKGYQKQDTAIISCVILKVKGIGYIVISPTQRTIVDVADYIIPPSENNAMFITTNILQTDQNPSICAESPSFKAARCEKDSDCKRKFLPKMNGIWTGRCLLPPEVNVSNETMNITKKAKGLCEYEGWCPAEDEYSPPMLVKNVLNFTLFIKNFIEFPAFDVKHKNMVDELKSCVFHPEKNKDCPIFTLDYIVNQAETDEKERKLMLQYGGVIRVKLYWDCNLDRNLKSCKPEYSFARLDVPFRDKPFSMGFNFRYASQWKHEQKNFRTLTKAYGLRLIISVSGKAGKFDFITLSLNTGSLVGIFGLATFLCDIILLHISKQARIYRNHVFEAVHLRTRMDSVLQPSTDQLHNNNRLSLNSESNGTTTSARKSPGKTVVTRPLTLINPEQLTRSEVI